MGSIIPALYASEGCCRTPRREWRMDVDVFCEAFARSEVLVLMRSLQCRLTFSAQPSSGKDQVWVFVTWEFLEPTMNGGPRMNVSSGVSWHVNYGAHAWIASNPNAWHGFRIFGNVLYLQSNSSLPFSKEPRIKYGTSDTISSSFVWDQSGVKLWEQVKRKSFCEWEVEVGL